MAFPSSAAASPADPRLRKRAAAAMANCSSEDGGIESEASDSSRRTFFAATNSSSSLPDTAHAQQTGEGGTPTVAGTHLNTVSAASAVSGVAADAPPPPMIHGSPAAASPVAASAVAGPPAAAAAAPLPYSAAAPPPPPPPPPFRGCMQSSAEGSAAAAAEGSGEEQIAAAAAAKGAWNAAEFSDAYTPPPRPPPSSSCQTNTPPAGAAAAEVGASPAAAAAAIGRGGGNSSSKNDEVPVQHPPPPGMLNSSNVEGEERGRTKRGGGIGRGVGQAEARGAASLARSRNSSSNSNSRNSSSSVNSLPVANPAPGGMRLYGRRAAMYHAASAAASGVPLPPGGGGAAAAGRGIGGKAGRKGGVQQQTFGTHNITIVRPPLAAAAPVSTASSFHQTVRGSATPPPPPLPPPPAGGGSAASSSYYYSYYNEEGDRETAGAAVSVANIGVRGRARLQNDYTQHFVDVGERPQNFIRDCEEERRFMEYPKLERLMHLKKYVQEKRNTPSMCIQANLRNFDWSLLGGIKFDVLLVDPPWQEYYDRCAAVDATDEDLTPWSLKDLMHLPLEIIGDTPSFCFLWCGVMHLEDARLLLAKDTHLIHANLDTDILVCEEEAEVGSTRKPEELYDVIERFCLGRRRIELFGRDCNRRAGWVTVGCELGLTTFDAKTYASYFEGDRAWPEATDYWGGRYVGTSPEIEMLRPKSPPRGANLGERGGGGS